MKLNLNRGFFTENSTGSTLYVNGIIQCFVLEDTVRDEKIYGKTAIPYGTYGVVLSESKRFGKIMPEILNVPNFSGIRIHSGNTSEDTLGCLLVGEQFVIENDDLKILNSKIAFDKLMVGLRKASDANESITIEIK